mmetsp:Transcript_18855/g.26748  ORF Transcript_18855/g.26748 Transcript_18855/m.26748 type:complete len:132 (+) Transcript_18855:211-606(+)
MSVRLVVGDYVGIVRGRYAGKYGYVRRVTVWKVAIELIDGTLVMVYQSSVEKCVVPEGGIVSGAEIEAKRKVGLDQVGKKMGNGVGGVGKRGGVVDQKLLVARIEAEIGQVRRSLDVVECLMKHLSVGEER